MIRPIPDRRLNSSWNQVLSSATSNVDIQAFPFICNLVCKFKSRFNPDFSNFHLLFLPLTKLMNLNLTVFKRLWKFVIGYTGLYSLAVLIAGWSILKFLVPLKPVEAGWRFNEQKIYIQLSIMCLNLIERASVTIISIVGGTPAAKFPYVVRSNCFFKLIKSFASHSARIWISDRNPL